MKVSADTSARPAVRLLLSGMSLECNNLLELLKLNPVTEHHRDARISHSEQFEKCHLLTTPDEKKIMTVKMLCIETGVKLLSLK